MNITKPSQLVSSIVMLCVFFMLTMLTACSTPEFRPGVSPPPSRPSSPEQDMTPVWQAPAASNQSAELQKMGYSIQVGAFSNIDNAVRLEQLLESRGIEAYYFRHESGLYKVRFGNHASYKPARSEAERLQAQGLIDSFFIVFPGDYAAAKIKKSGKGNLRYELISTAKRFIGTPYRWGGTSVKNGFDCSGLTMVCYRLNGLNLPRVSRNQFKSGKWVSKASLQPGDLVFFATKGGNRVTHVGMYIGNGEFIHAPRTGKNVRVEKLSNSFFAKTYMGGRTYL